MDAALALVVFAPALALGSFLNVVAARLPDGRSLVRPRSACGACEKEIAWYDNIPVVSYFLLRGRCRSCGASFSARYPAVEIATALLVAACFWHFGLTGEAVVGAYFCAALVVSLLQGRERGEALARARAAEAIAASWPGAQPSLPTAVELKEILAR